MKDARQPTSPFGSLTNLDAYAATETFEASTDLGQAGVVNGIAAPLNGPKPCLVALIAGSEIIAISQASQFSPNAHAKKVRLGWCGYSIGGISQAIAIDPTPELRCAVSGRVLMRLEGEMLAARIQPPIRPMMSVDELRARLQVEAGASDIEQVMPFAIELFHRKGPEALVVASYRYILDRQADAAGLLRYAADCTDPQNIRNVWASMMHSDEFRARKRKVLPGPFDPDFPFSRNCLDTN